MSVNMTTAEFFMDYESPAFYIKVLSVLSYFILNLFGYLRDFLVRSGIEKNRTAVEKNREVQFMPSHFRCSCKQISTGLRAIIQRLWPILHSKYLSKNSKWLESASL